MGTKEQAFFLFVFAALSGASYAAVCGNVSQSIVLNQNLLAQGNCFNVEASNITIDGNGFSITGNSTNYGINNSAGFDNITIKNLFIANFTTAIYGAGMANSLIFNNSILGPNSTTAYQINLLSSSTNNNISSNTILSYARAIYIRSQKNAVHRNNITCNCLSPAIDFSIGSDNSNATQNIVKVNRSGSAIEIGTTDNVTILYSTVNATNSTGIYVSSSINRGSNASFNDIFTYGSQADGINAGDNLFAAGNRINLSAANSDGVIVNGASNVTILSNDINVSGSSSHGIYVQSSSGSIASGNNITVTGQAVAGIYISLGVLASNFTSNEINVRSQGDGIYVGQSNYSIISGNNLTATGSGAGVILAGSYFSNISYNSIATFNISSYGVYIQSGYNNTLSWNSIATNGSGAYPVYSFGDFSSFFSNNISSYIISTHAIYSAGQRASVYGNNLTTYKQTSYGVYVTDTFTNVSYNIINTTSGSSVGIYFDVSAGNGTADGNQITTKLSNAHGILYDTDNGTITRNNIRVFESLTSGIYVTDSNDSAVAFNAITTNEIQSYGIHLQTTYRATVNENRIFSNRSDGLRLQSSDQGRISSNNITSYSSSIGGIYFYLGADSNALEGNNVTVNGTNSHAVYFDGTHENNSFTNDHLNSINALEIYAVSGNARNTMLSNVILEESVNISGVLNNINLDTNESFPSPSSGMTAVGRALNISGSASNPSISFNIYYTDSDIAGIDESTIRVNKYNTSASAWQAVSASVVNQSENAVYSGNVTSFFLFGVMGNDSVVYGSPCGNVSQSIVLNQSLTSQGNCFNVEANNVVIDGRGFTITGDSSGFGVNNSAGFDNVTVKNLIIKNYTNGVSFSNSDNSTISGNNIESVNVTFGYGISLSGSRRNLVSSNNLTTIGQAGRAIRLSSSSMNYIFNNTVLTYGGAGSGVYLSSSSDNNTASYNNLTTKSDGSGVETSFSSNNTFTGNVIYTNFSGGHGIYIDNSFNNSAYYNTVRILGQSSYGFYPSSSPFSAAFGNNIETNSSAAFGVYFASSTNGTAVGNAVRTYGSGSYGIYFYLSDYGNASWNNVSTINGTGILSGSSIYGNALYNTVETLGPAIYGMYMSGSNYTLFHGNNISTNGSSSHGILLISSGSYNNISYNNIRTNASGAHGVSTQVNNNTIQGNSIFTRETTAYGVYLTGSFLTAIGNNITTDKLDASGVYLAGGTGHSVGTNNVTTYGQTAHGIYSVAGASNYTSNKIATHGVSAFGVYLHGGSRVSVYGNNITTFQSLSDGVEMDFGAGANNITGNYIHVFNSLNSAVYINGGGNSTIDYNTIKSNNTQSNGIYIASSNRNDIKYNSIEVFRGAGYPLYLQQAGYANISGNNITAHQSNAVYFYIGNNVNNTFEGNNLTASGSAVYLDNGNDNTFRGGYITSLGSNDIYSDEPSSGNTFENVMLSGVNFSTSSFVDASFKAYSNPPASPEGKTRIYGAINISNTSSSSYVQFNISYQDADIATVSEATLRIHRYNVTAGQWDNISGSIDTSRNTVNSGNLTSFSTFSLMGDDSAAPRWAGVASSPPSPAYAKNALYQFNATWVSASFSYIEHNFTGSLQNYTASSQSTAFYYYYYDLPVGTYAFRFYANNTIGWNSTSQSVYSVSKGTPPLSLSFSNSTYGAMSFINGSSSVDSSGYNLTLLRNGTLVNQTVSFNYATDSALLPAHSFNYTIVYNGSFNYSGAFAERLLVVSKAPTATILELNGTRADSTYAKGTHANITANLNISGDVSVYANYTGTESQIDSGASPRTNTTNTSNLNAATYSIKANYSGNENFSYSEESWLLRVSDAAPQILYVFSSAAQSSATITWATDVSSNATVYYGTSSLDSSSSNSTLDFNHTITITGLSSGTLYYFNVSSCDIYGSCNSSVTYNFTTASSATTTTLSVGSGGGAPPAAVPSPTTTLKASAQNKSTETEKAAETLTKERVHTNLNVTITKIDAIFEEGYGEISVKDAEGPDIENAYGIFEITSTVKIAKANISFMIPLEWIEKRNATVSDIRMYHHTGGWVELKTASLGVEYGNAMFSAETNGFSLFAIAIKPRVLAEPLNYTPLLMGALATAFLILYISVRKNKLGISMPRRSL